jgi:hypothetical protein
MILRRYGNTFHSVDVNFDSLALSEIAFRRNRETSIAADDVESSYAVVSSHELVAEADGDVQDETEQVLLDRLGAQITELLEGLTPDEVLVVENEQGRDWPKTRQRTSNVIVDGENRLHFHYTLSPPLRVSVRRRGS